MSTAVPARTRTRPTSIDISAEDVFAFAGIRRSSAFHPRPVAFVFPVAHVLSVPANTAGLQVLDSGTGLLRASLHNVAAVLKVTVPDFDKWGPVAPYKGQKKTTTVPVTVSGTALLERDPPGSATSYRVRVGMLCCPAGPVFLAMRNPDPVIQGSLLMTLWPSWSRDGSGLDYAFAPQGLCLRGTLGAAGSPDLLRLPRRAGDLAWVPGPDAQQYFAAWDWSGSPVQPNTGLTTGMAREIAPARWAEMEGPWAVLRWRVVTPGPSAVLDQAFDRTFPGASPGLRLEHVGKADSTTPGGGDGDLLAHLSAVHTPTTMDFVHQGGLCVSGRPVLAHLQWRTSQRTSVMRSDSAIANWRLAPRVSGVVEWTGWTVRTARRPLSGSSGVAPNPELEIAWDVGRPAAPSMKLAPSDMFYAGLLDSSGNVLGEGELKPEWLATDDGFLQMFPEALGAAAPPEIVNWSTTPAQQFSGGVPLDALGGPSGATAWVPDSTPDSQFAGAVLAVQQGQARLLVRKPIITWESPEWWVSLSIDPRESSSVRARGSIAMPDEPEGPLPGLQARLRSAFEAGFGVPPPASLAAARLRTALLGVFRGTYWVGRAGTGVTDAWKLSVTSAGGVEFALPGSLRARVKAWSRFEAAYLVRTVPESGENGTGALLDPMRAMFPVRPAPSTSPLVLQVTRGRLPKHVQRPFAAAGTAAPGWVRVEADGFLPHVAGLALEGADVREASVVMRHGNQMHLERLLRMGADGNDSGTVITSPLAEARPADDVAFRGGAASVAGWLPQPFAVRIAGTRVEWGGDRPRLEFTVNGWADTFTLSADVDGNGLADAAWVALPAPGTAPQLVRPDTPAAQPMLNFGQPLVPLQSSEALDGAGRIQGLFDGAAHPQRTLPGAQPTETGVTLVRAARLAWAGGAASNVALNLVDWHAAAAKPGGWDLGGTGAGQHVSRPMLGPCALVPRDLLACTGSVARVSVKLAPPWTPPDGAQLDDSPALELAWTRLDNAWVESLSPTALVWRFGGTGARLELRALHLQLAGTASALRANVTMVEFETASLGIVRVVPDAPGPLTWGNAQVADSVSYRLVCTTGGLAVDLTLTGRPGVGRCEWTIQVDQPFRWGPPGKQGTHLVLDEKSDLRLEGLAIGDLLPPLAIETARAGENRWLMSMASDRSSLAGSLSSSHPAHGSTQWSLSCNLKWGDCDPRRLLSACDPASSWLVLVVRLVWASGDAAPAPARTARASGSLAFVNDFCFRMADGTLWQDRVEAVFDGQDCTVAPDGSLSWSSSPDLLCTHRVGPAAALPRVEFTLAHEFQASAGSISCAHLAFLSLQAIAPAAFEPQIIYGPGRALGVAPVAVTADDAYAGIVLRLPVRSGGATVEVAVPPSTGRDLAWFPLSNWRNWPEALPDDPSTDPWHERRALAPCLGKAALGELAQAQRVARFAGGAGLPQKNEILEEYAELARLAHWPLSGMLAGDGGVCVMPWRGAAVAEEAVQFLVASTSHSAQVSLLAVGPESAGGFRRFATGLVSGVDANAPGRGSVADWARDEMTRRRHRSPALAVVLGRNELNVLFARAMAAQQSLTATPDPVGVEAVGPPHSLPIDFLFGTELPASTAPARQRAALAARLDDGAIVEVVHALPRAEGLESATEYRLVLNGALTANRWGTATAYGLDQRRFIQFESDTAADAALAQPMPSLDAADPEDVIAPPIVDAALWSYRPGESVWTHWSAGLGASTLGPGVNIRLRAPRASHTVRASGGASEGESFVLAEVAAATAGGADWRLRQVTRVRSIGRPYVDEYDNLLTIALPRGVQHILEPQTALGPTVAPVAVALTRSRDATGVHDMPDPLIVGVFPGTSDPSDIWGLAVVDGAQMTTASLPSVQEVLASASWTSSAPDRAINLRTFGKVGDLGAANPQQAVAYSADAGLELAKLVRGTPRMAGTTSRPEIHWLHQLASRSGAGTPGLAFGPRLALWIQHVGANSVVLVPNMQIVWIDDTVNDQAPHICTVSASQVSGFAPLAGGPNGIELATDRMQFEHWRRAYVLEWPSQRGHALAWMFEASGACSAIARL